MRSEVTWPTIPAMVRHSAGRFGDACAVVDGTRRVDFATLRGMVDDAARALMASGIERGDRVALWAPNSLEWIVAALGVTTAGGVLVPVNTRFRGAEAAFVLARSSARVLFTVRGFLGTDYPALLTSVGIDLPALEETILLSGDVDGRSVRWDEFLTCGRSVTELELDVRLESIAADDPSDVVFTSGTTGNPKGVVMTHSQTLRAYLDWCDWADLRPRDRYLIVNPFFHIFGYKAGCLACLMRGATIFPLPSFDPAVVLELVEREQISVLPGPPTIYLSLLDHPDRAGRDLSSLRVAVTGAAEIPVELIRRVRQELPFERILTGYGLTEAGTVTGSRPDDDFEHTATTVGVPWPGFEVRTMTDAGGDTSVGEPGEVAVRGETVMRALPRRPRGNRGRDRRRRMAAHRRPRHLRRRRLPAHRRTDQRHVHRRWVQRLSRRDRKPPAPSRGVAQAAVIGVPDVRLGEVGMAFVVLTPGPALEPSEIIEWARSEMANFKAPRFVEFCDALPVNATGKVVKDELRVGANTMTTAYETIRYKGAATDGDGMARMTLHRPERLNACTNLTQRVRDAALLLGAANAADATEGVAAFRDRRRPDFKMRVPDDLPATSPWWEPDEWTN